MAATSTSPFVWHERHERGRFVRAFDGITVPVKPADGFLVVMRGPLPVIIFTSVFTIALLAAPAHAESGDVVAEGHIAAGVFGASIISYGLYGDPLLPGADGSYGFRAPIEGLDGVALETVVHDGGGVGYFVKLAFADHEGHGLPADCHYGDGDHGLLEQPFGTAEIAEQCVVPEGAVTVIVTAHTGALLDVTLRLA